VSGERPETIGRFWNIKRTLIGVMALLSALFVLPAALGLGEAHRELERSRQTAEMLEAGIHLFAAVRNFGYERGRVNVVLNHAGPLEEMRANREFIAARRGAGEAELNLGLEALLHLGLDGMPEALIALREVRAEVPRLRERVDEEMLRPKAQRDPGLARIWFVAMSEMITKIQDILALSCVRLAGFDGPTASIAYLMLASTGMRDQCAPEISILSGVMLSGQPIPEEARQKIMLHRGRSRQLVNDLRALSASLGDPGLAQGVAQFERLYRDRYLPLGQAVFLAAERGGPYPVSQKEFLATGVAALEGLVKVMEAIADLGQSRARQVQERARGEFVLNLAVMLAGLLVLIMVVPLAARRVIGPLSELTRATLRIASRQLDFQVPYQERQDEIGAVARAVEVLQRDSERMIKDYELLEDGKRRVEKALAEVRTLQGLLPICASCKRIRDDQGYWKQLEAYISQHTEAQFSHGICPECMQKLYPELFGKPDR
jgi:HAMP domain-containing protein